MGLKPSISAAQSLTPGVSKWRGRCRSRHGGGVKNCQLPALQQQFPALNHWIGDWFKAVFLGTFLSEPSIYISLIFDGKNPWFPVEMFPTKDPIPLIQRSNRN